MNKVEPRIYGLTGIASGKTTMGKFFRDYGIPVIDADQIARVLRAPGGGADPAILARFGTNEASKLREIISQDSAARIDLEDFTPSHSRGERGPVSDLALEKIPYLVYEATFLIEAGRAADFDGVILVESKDELRLNRLMGRDAMNEAQARRFIDAQTAAFASHSDRESASTHRVINDGLLSQLRETTRLLHLEFLARALRER